MVVVNKVRQERLQKVVQSHSSQNSSSDTPESVLISISDVHFGRREREHDAYGHSQEESQEARAGAFDDLRFTKKSAQSACTKFKPMHAANGCPSCFPCHSHEISNHTHDLCQPSVEVRAGSLLQSAYEQLYWKTIGIFHRDGATDGGGQACQS
jgi:hypothetical protein